MVAAESAVRSVALVLHGRIGIWRVRASHIDDATVVWQANAPQRWREAPKSMDSIDHTQHSTLAGFAAFGQGSMYQHVIEPNRRAGVRVDLFLHSWHSEIGKQLDAMYKPIASKHEEVRRTLHPVRSQHLSMKTALALCAAHASTKRKPYDLVMVSRYDVLFFRPLLLGKLTGAPLWLPHWCHRYPLDAKGGMLVRSACGNWPGHGEGYLVHPATSVGIHPPMKGKISREPDYDFAYLDWWFVAKPEVAHTWGEIYDKFEAYKTALARIAPFPTWGHFFWGYHINRILMLRRKVRYVLWEGRDFRLARHWHLGTHCMHYLSSGQRRAESESAVAKPQRLQGNAAAAASTSTSSTSTSVDPSGAFDALARLNVVRNIFYRRIQPNAATPHSSGQTPADDANATIGGRAAGEGGAMVMARQCPLDARVRLYCPWLSPVCPADVRAAVLDIEAAAHLAIQATSKLPKWALFGGVELDDVRTDSATQHAPRPPA